jgi:hypothetical protein
MFIGKYNRAKLLELNFIKDKFAWNAQLMRNVNARNVDAFRAHTQHVPRISPYFPSITRAQEAK